MGNPSFESPNVERFEELKAGYPFRPTRSSRAVRDWRTCLDFSQGVRDFGDDPSDRHKNLARKFHLAPKFPDFRVRVRIPK
jgi:hypothetical protein